MSEPMLMVSVRATDAQVRIPGSNYRHHCSDCGAAVVISPSSEKMMAEHPGFQIVCNVCFNPPRDLGVMLIPEGQLEELRGPVEPNDWTRRN